MGRMGAALPGNLKSLETSVGTAGAGASQIPQKPGEGKSRPAPERPAVGSGQLATGHAQGVARRVGSGSRDEPGSACACPSAREVVLFRVLRAVAVRREPRAGPARTPPAPPRCPATASLTMRTPGEGRPRSWVRTRPQPFPTPGPWASSAAI